MSSDFFLPRFISVLNQRNQVKQKDHSDKKQANPRQNVYRVYDRVEIFPDQNREPQTENLYHNRRRCQQHTQTHRARDP